MIYCNKIIVCPVGKRHKKMKAPKKLVGKKLDPIAENFPMNYKRDPGDSRDYSFKTLLMETPMTVTTAVDHSKGMSPIKDQGQLGSCVGFAVTAMKEWQEKKEHEAEMAKGKRGRPKVYNYSEAWVYWNAKKIDPWGVLDEGTSIRYAMKVLHRIGVPTEKGWPYKDINDLEAIGEPKKWADLVARWALIDSYWRVDNLSELKSALNVGPVPIGVPCFVEIFYTGSDGIVSYPNDPDTIYGGHAVCAVGYDDKTRMVKFRNSWGKGWGENGYGYLPYEYIIDFLWDAWASEDLSVTRDMLKGTRELV